MPSIYLFIHAGVNVAYLKGVRRIIDMGSEGRSTLPHDIGVGRRSNAWSRSTIVMIFCSTSLSGDLWPRLFSGSGSTGVWFAFLALGSQCRKGRGLGHVLMGFHFLITSMKSTWCALRRIWLAKHDEPAETNHNNLPTT